MLPVSGQCLSLRAARLLCRKNEQEKKDIRLSLPSVQSSREVLSSREASGFSPCTRHVGGGVRGTKHRLGLAASLPGVVSHRHAITRCPGAASYPYLGTH